MREHVKHDKLQCGRPRRCLAACLLLLFLAGCSRQSAPSVGDGKISLEEVTESVETAEQVAVTEPSQAAELQAEEEAVDPESVRMNAPMQQIAVDVCGAVRVPGLYRLDEGSRIDDAIRAAGGFSEGAAEEGVNLAYVLKDGMQIRVPTEEEVLAYSDDAGQSFAGQILVVESSRYSVSAGRQGEPASTQAASDGRLNLNSATLEELMKLPGIGESRARAILAYREEHGGFHTPEDLMKISGIKSASYEKLKSLVKCE